MDIKYFMAGGIAILLVQLVIGNVSGIERGQNLTYAKSANSACAPKLASAD